MAGQGSGLPCIEHLADFGNQVFQRKWFLNEFDVWIKDAVSDITDGQHDMVARANGFVPRRITGIQFIESNG